MTAIPKLSLFPALALAFAVSASGAEDTSSFQGQAVDRETGAVLYREEHVGRSSGGKPLSLQTRFVRPDGSRIAERSLDFSAAPFAPAYRFEDFRTGWVEGAETKADGIHVYCRKGEGKPMMRKRLAVPAPAVIDGGFNAFLRHHREALARGKRIGFQFVVPSRLAWYRFEAFLENPEGRKDGAPMVFVAVPRNAALRLVAPRIEVAYDPASDRMVGYEGISNLAAEKGGNQYIRLTYSGGGP